ncbi:hypothetical protein K435DRAFT_345121 [Dendrothele bispora CBS 962.96]|uniref:Uncharacterized protein n=1 Tax=Dendrothele bispora (strain CBS 962.96) TaxID=1314807 RepID=A0A4S8MIH7_DENBC|nr:hypothetical protein K435DRAFT_345121 [Dendrothele bispora CBS 962.96]
MFESRTITDHDQSKRSTSCGTRRALSSESQQQSSSEESDGSLLDRTSMTLPSGRGACVPVQGRSGELEVLQGVLQLNAVQPNEPFPLRTNVEGWATTHSKENLENVARKVRYDLEKIGADRLDLIACGELRGEELDGREVTSIEPLPNFGPYRNNHIVRS